MQKNGLLKEKFDEAAKLGKAYEDAYSFWGGLLIL